MANWNEIKTSVSSAANKTLKVAGELADSAKLNFKLKTLSAKASGKFEKLGRLTYRQLKTDTSYAEEIATVIADIDDIRAQIKDIKAKIEAAKEERAAAKAQADDICAEAEEATTEEAATAECDAE